MGMRRERRGKALLILLALLALFLMVGWILVSAAGPNPEPEPTLRPTPAAVTIVPMEWEQHYTAHLLVRIGGDPETNLVRGYAACDGLLRGGSYQAVLASLDAETGNHAVSVIIVDAARQNLCRSVDF